LVIFAVVSEEEGRAS